MILEKAFYYEVVGPIKKLVARATENVCVEPNFNDVVSLAKYASTAAYHFREPMLKKSDKDKLGPMADQTAESLRQRLGDVTDSAKHGHLRKAGRFTTFQAGLAFEYDQDMGFRFLRTEAIATNGRFGTFEISDIILEFIPLLAKELNIKWNEQEIELNTHPFNEWAETYLAPESVFDLQQVKILIYQKAANGTLKLFDPPEVKFRVLQK